MSLHLSAQASGDAEPRRQGILDDQDHDGAESAARGSLSGGAVVGLLGARGTVLIPGIGPVIAGGLLGSALGGIGGALTGMGVSKPDAEYYAHEFRGGRTPVTVDPGDRRTGAEQIVRDHHALRRRQPPGRLGDGARRRSHREFPQIPATGARGWILRLLSFVSAFAPFSSGRPTPCRK